MPETAPRLEPVRYGYKGGRVWSVESDFLCRLVNGRLASEEELAQWCDLPQTVVADLILGARPVPTQVFRGLLAAARGLKSSDPHRASAIEQRVMTFLTGREQQTPSAAGGSGPVAFEPLAAQDVRFECDYDRMRHCIAWEDLWTCLVRRKAVRIAGVTADQAALIGAIANDQSTEREECIPDWYFNAEERAVYLWLKTEPSDPIGKAEQDEAAEQKKIKERLAELARSAPVTIPREQFDRIAESTNAMIERLKALTSGKRAGKGR